MILLLHLTHCPSLDHERSLRSDTLLAEAFELVGNRQIQGRIVSSNADTARSQGRSEKANLIYCLLAKLGFRVWKRSGWQDFSPSGKRTCPIENLADAIRFACSEELSQPQGQDRDTTGNNRHPPGVESEVPIRPIEEIELDQYGDLLEQFLEPGVMA